MTLLQPQNGTFSQVFSPGTPFQPQKTHTPPLPLKKLHRMESKQDGKRCTVNHLQILHSYFPANIHAHFCPVFWQNQALLGPKTPVCSEVRLCVKPVENLRPLRGETSGEASIPPSFWTHSNEPFSNRRFQKRSALRNGCLETARLHRLRKNSSWPPNSTAL